MKKSTYFIALVLMTVLLSLNKSKAASITGHYYYDYCTGQTFEAVTNVTTFHTYKVEFSYGDGHMDSSYVDTASALAYHAYASAGTYTVKMVLIDAGGSRVDSITYSQVYTGCTWMWGMIYHDNNSNCVYDAGDAYFYYYPMLNIEVDSGSVPVDTIIGYYYFYYKALATGKTYTFKVLNSIAGLTLTCPSTGTITATSTPSSLHVGDLGYECSTSTSFDVAIHPYARASAYYYAGFAFVTNNSCNTKSGNYSITIDSRYTHIINTYPAGGTVSGSTITWSYSGLDIDHPKWFYVYAHGDSSSLAAIGSTLTTTMDVTPISSDADTTNNHWTCTDTVKSSWDPNEKQVSPQGNVPAGTTLTYTLKFENTGNAPAKNIHILDTLSGNLDINSLQMVSSTHAVTLTKLNAGSRTVLKFDFANINLPDSSHHGQADGYVTFSIKTKTGLSTGTTIDNRAGIYFDTNPVVMTNTVQNMIHPLAVPVLSTAPVSVYPNPVHTDLVVKTGNGNYKEISVINAVGEILIQQPVQSNETHIDMHLFTPGLYFIMLKGTDGVKVEKVEKL